MSSNPTGREDHTGGTSRPAAYPAPTATGPLHATVAVPGSKSWTNRWLTLAALASGPSTLRSPLDARDTQLMAGALRALGHEVRTDAGSTNAAWRVTPAHAWHAPAAPNCWSPRRSRWPCCCRMPTAPRPWLRCRR